MLLLTADYGLGHCGFPEFCYPLIHIYIGMFLGLYLPVTALYLLVLILNLFISCITQANSGIVLRVDIVIQPDS